MLDKFFSHYKNRRIAVVLALLGTVTPLAGLQKFYLGQPVWGIIYLLLGSTPIPRIACAIDVVWYLIQDIEQFELQFNGYTKQPVSNTDTKRITAIADSLRELDKLRQDGLMSEYEFEQKRRQLLDRLV